VWSNVMSGTLATVVLAIFPLSIAFVAVMEAFGFD
jgi:hypothetical protein